MSELIPLDGPTRVRRVPLSGLNLHTVDVDAVGNRSADLEHRYYKPEDGVRYFRLHGLPISTFHEESKCVRLGRAAAELPFSVSRIKSSNGIASGAANFKI